MVFAKELKKNLMVVPSKWLSFPLPAPDRIESLIDPQTFVEYDADLRSVDPLKFKGVASYQDKLEQKTNPRQILRMRLFVGLDQWEGIP